MDRSTRDPGKPVDPNQKFVDGVKGAAKRAILQAAFAVVFATVFVTIAAVPAKLIYRWAVWLWSLIQ